MTKKMEEGFKNEENARQLIQWELAVVKDELKNVKMGSSSTVCTEDGTGICVGSGTFARPPTFRRSEIFIPRKMEFEGWVTDYSRGSIQGSTDSEVEKLVSDLEKGSSGTRCRGWACGTRE